MALASVTHLVGCPSMHLKVTGGSIPGLRAQVGLGADP